MKQMVDEVRPENRRTYGRLAGAMPFGGGHAGRSGTDVERAGASPHRAGLRGSAVESPEHAKMAEEVIVKARQVLRKPTWWEPTRRFQPKSDPGNTF